MEKGKKNEKSYSINEITREKLHEVYQREINPQSHETELTLEGFRRLLIDFDIDESFALPMFRIIAGWNVDKILTFDKFVEFFETMQKKDLKLFYQLLFKAMDTDGDGLITKSDLIKFSEIVSDKITEDEAVDILDSIFNSFADNEDETVNQPFDGNLNKEQFCAWLSNEKYL